MSFSKGVSGQRRKITGSRGRHSGGPGDRFRNGRLFYMRSLWKFQPGFAETQVERTRISENGFPKRNRCFRISKTSWPSCFFLGRGGIIKTRPAPPHPTPSLPPSPPPPIRQTEALVSLLRKIIVSRISDWDG